MKLVSKTRSDPQDKGLIWSYRLKITAETRGIQLPQRLNDPHWVDTKFAQDGFHDDLEEFFGYFCA